MKVCVEKEELCITLEGFEKVWALKRRLVIPLQNIQSVRVESGDHDLTPTSGGLRFPGTFVPWVIRAGSYLTGDGWEFWSVHRGQFVLVLKTRNEHYTRLFLGTPKKERAEALRRMVQKNI